jgi:site-specific DNA-methyltransferase (adenine-specific)
MQVTEKIYIENCNNMELMARYPDNYFSLGITDIPYGIDVGNMAFIKETKNLVKQKNGNKLNPFKNKKLKPSDWDKTTPEISWWNEFKRITKHQIFFGVEYVDWYFGNGRIKWNKGFAEGMSFKKYEMAYCSFIDYEKEIDYLYAGMMQGKSISEPMVQQGNKQLNEKREHPTQKPIILWDIILLFCIEKGIDITKIIDSNMGLASLIMSSIKFNEVREIVGCDINKEYYDKAIQRIKNHVSQQKLF